LSYFTKRSKRIVAGTLAGALALSVSPILGFTGVASAADPLPPLADPIGAGNFCEGAPTTEPFTDVSATDPSLDEIICLVATGLTKGTTPTTYSPNASITRRQMALFIKRLADLSNKLDTGTQVAALPAYDGTTAPFTDIAGESTEAKEAIGQLQQADIVQGTTATTYSPGANVTRRQMAAFINRLEKFLTGAEFTTTKDFFNDDNGDTGEANLNAVASVGIFQGDGAGNVFPGANLTRRQMANVLLRHAQVMMDQGDIGRAFQPASVTSLPELTTAKIVKTVTAGQVSPTNPIGTWVDYTFDESVALFAPNPALFHLYNADASLADETGAVVQARTGPTVTMRFPALDTAAEAAGLVLATVDSDAVSDDQNQENPEGDAALNAASSGGNANLPAGITNAPDLVSVGNFRQGANVGETAVDFTFDEVAFNDPPGAYRLILLNGSEVNCDAGGPVGAGPSGGTIPGGNGTAVHTVICVNPDITVPTPNGTPLTATNVSRGITAGQSEKAGANNNTDDQAELLGAADVAAGGNTPDPDLVSIELRPADATKDQVLFVFDEEVAAGGLFAIYKVNDPSGAGAVVGGAAVINAANKTQVLVDFAEGAVTGAVGGITAGAPAVDDGSPGFFDEVGVANTLPTPANSAGNTAAPQLVSVALSAPPDAFNNPQPFRATYTFDEAVENAVNGEFFLYAADGTRYVATACTTGLVATPADVTDDATVTCTAYDNAATAVDATSAQVGATKIGTVDDQAVEEKGVGILENPEGAAATTGGTA